MAAALAVHDIPDPLKRLHGRTARNPGETTQAGISTTSSAIPGPVPDGPNPVSTVAYNALYFLFIFGFTYFYTSVVFVVEDVADNLRRYSSFIPGIRPGKPTADYLRYVMNRITFAGAVFLGIITVLLPIVGSRLTSIPRNQMYLGGTALLIVVGVALDTMKQLQTQLVMRQYRGFIK